MARADRYALRIPDRYADSVRWRRRRAGRVEAVHPAFLVLGGTAGLVYQALDPDEARGAEVARAARLSASATSAALRVLAEHGLAERGPGGWRRGAVALADVAESTGAADLQREREERYRQDRESWRARLRQYQGASGAGPRSRDGWWSLEDEDEYDEMCRWPVILNDGVRAPPGPSRAGTGAQHKRLARLSRFRPPRTADRAAYQLTCGNITAYFRYKLTAEPCRHSPYGCGDTLWTPVAAAPWSAETRLTGRMSGDFRLFFFWPVRGPVDRERG